MRETSSGSTAFPWQILKVSDKPIIASARVASQRPEAPMDTKDLMVCVVL